MFTPKLPTVALGKSKYTVDLTIYHIVHDYDDINICCICLYCFIEAIYYKQNIYCILKHLS